MATSAKHASGSSKGDQRKRPPKFEPLYFADEDDESSISSSGEEHEGSYFAIPANMKRLSEFCTTLSKSDSREYLRNVKSLRPRPQLQQKGQQDKSTPKRKPLSIDKLGDRPVRIHGRGSRVATSRPSNNVQSRRSDMVTRLGQQIARSDTGSRTSASLKHDCLMERFLRTSLITQGIIRKSRSKERIAMMSRK